ncbi:hypothetical protein DV736_g6573, partial [Chaetothyriales sp. CBS 134916]
MDPPRSRRKAAVAALTALKEICGQKRKRDDSPTKPPLKARRRKLDATPSPGPKEIYYKPTPTTKRIASHPGLETPSMLLVDKFELQIMVQARGVTRMFIPLDQFRSIYLDWFTYTERFPKLKSKAMQRVGKGNWKQESFFRRLRTALPSKELNGLKLASSFSKTLPGFESGKEPASQPDIFLYVANKNPLWENISLLIEHSQISVKDASKKFLQWMRNAWNVFHHQPFRRHLYGILFLQPHALICYADHGFAGYSEPLDFSANSEHNNYLMDFLHNFIAHPEHRGQDPTVTIKAGRTYIQYCGTRWIELPEKRYHRPSVTGRNVMVVRVKRAGPAGEELDDCEGTEWVMKLSWEEILKNSSPPPEQEILRILDRANVRGLPKLDLSTILSDEEIITRGFPEDCKNAFTVFQGKTMAQIESSYLLSSHRPAPGLSTQQHLPQVRLQKSFFNERLEVRRRLYRTVMSYCQPLTEAMRNGGPKELVGSICDAMIVYFEVYMNGFLHGDISTENIVVPVKGSKLTGEVTYQTQRGTLIDWNLCFNADGTASGRSFRSGTPAFVAPSLLKNTLIKQRTLRHDMESFFAVMLWIASLNYEDEDAFRAKPLVAIAVEDKPSSDIANAKMLWFTNLREFKSCIIANFEDNYRKDLQFVRCMDALRRILYQEEDDDILSFINDRRNRTQETNNPKDPMDEGVFVECMAVLDGYLGHGDGKESGTYQLERLRKKHR